MFKVLPIEEEGLKKIIINVMKMKKDGIEEEI